MTQLSSMDLVTHSVLVMSAVAVTLALLYLRFWFSQTDRTDFILFALSCFWTAVYAWFEIAMMNTTSVQSLSELLWWSQLPAGFAVISVITFVYRYLEGGRRWLYWLVVGLRSFGILLNLVLTPNIVFRRVTGINYVTFLGEEISIPVGDASPFVLINEASLFLLLVFCVDAAIQVWRRGERRKAIIFGGGVACFGLYSLIVSASGVWLSTTLPTIASPAIMFVVMAMGYELNYDMHRSARLAKTLESREAELRESLKQLRLSADAADVGVTIRTAEGDVVWASNKWYELFDVEPSEVKSLQAFLERLHPADRKPVEKAMTSVKRAGEEYDIEYRVPLRDGTVRWIRSRGRADVTSDGSVILRGAAVDITKFKLARDAAHELSRKLINAQERERARLARELHDDLSQSLALLSIQVHSIASNSGDPTNLSSQLGNISSQIDRLSSDVHRISHELHPAKLEQLGLESALRGICREIGATHGVKIDFHTEGMPRSLPNDISLCLYRVAQESLQNIVKHSGASNARVELELVNDQIRLSIADNGNGFAISDGNEHGGLGLISMKERLRSVDGTIRIDSTVGAGTKVVASVPIESTWRGVSDSAAKTVIAY